MISQFHERRRANRETWLLAHGLYVYLFINFYTHSRSESLTFSRYHPGSLTDNWCRRTPLCCSEGWRQLWRIYHGCRRKQKSGMFNWFFFPFIIISWQNEILSSEASVLGTILWWRWGFFLNYVPWSKTQKNIRVVQAILFLAPLAFNLTLEEDPRVNRLVWCLLPPPSQKMLINIIRKTASTCGVNFVQIDYWQQRTSLFSSTRSEASLSWYLGIWTDTLTSAHTHRKTC